MTDSSKVIPIFLEISRICELLEKSERTLPDALLKTEEELGELISAYFGMKSYKKNTEKDLQEEVVDVLQCAISLYFLVNEKHPFDLAALLKAKNDKWEKKYAKRDVKPDEVADLGDMPDLPKMPSLGDPDMFRIHPGQILWTQQTNPCENCSFYQRMKTGAPYIGDTPCNWCKYGPFTINCSSTDLGEFDIATGITSNCVKYSDD